MVKYMTIFMTCKVTHETVEAYRVRCLEGRRRRVLSRSEKPEATAEARKGPTPRANEEQEVLLGLVEVVCE